MGGGRAWSENETKLLVDFVLDNYIFLTASISQRKTKSDIDNKWKELTTKLNSLGVSSTPLQAKQVKKNGLT